MLLSPQTVFLYFGMLKSSSWLDAPTCPLGYAQEVKTQRQLRSDVNRILTVKEVDGEGFIVVGYHLNLFKTIGGSHDS